MSISDRMQNDGLSFEEARMKESLTMPSSTEALLNERGKTHGDFRDHANTAQSLKATFGAHCKNKLSAVQLEAVDMILHKLGRIAAGDPNFVDHWDDIAGYAKLVSQGLQREKPGSAGTELRHNPPIPGAHVAQYQVRCHCGWSGMQAQLRWNMPKDRYECPLCSEEFKDFFVPTGGACCK